jgi:CRISPR-associated protein Cas2
MKMKAIIDESEDSVIVFTNKMGYNMNKQILGKERMTTDNFL